MRYASGHATLRVARPPRGNGSGKTDAQKRGRIRRGSAGGRAQEDNRPSSLPPEGRYQETRRKGRSAERAKARQARPRTGGTARGGAAVNGSGASARRRAEPSFGGPSSVVAPCGPRRRGTWTMARIWIFRARAAWSTLGSGRQRSARPCERPPKRAEASGAGAGAEQGGLSF